MQDRIARDSAITVSPEAIDFRPPTSRDSFMDAVRKHDAIVHLISLHFLQSRYCMQELLALMREDDDRNYYRERTVPLIVTDSKIELFQTSGQYQLVEYWRKQGGELEVDLDAAGGSGRPSALDDLRERLAVTRDITDQISRFMRVITESPRASSYQQQHGEGFAGVVDHLREIATSLSPPTDATHRIGRKIRQAMGVESPPTVAPMRSPQEQHLRRLCESIQVASESDPTRPEFPPFSPRFPATPIHRIYVGPLERNVMIKDESYNYTGSHKDRMAWEIVVHYQEILEDRLASSQVDKMFVPSASIISNGSAALAIQVLFRCFGLPALKVLIDDKTLDETEQKLLRAGCEVYKTDLSERVLDSSDVLELTDNPDGFDFTARNIVDPNRRKYYDWLAYEILNAGARHIFIPVGTGDLYVNVLTVLRDELAGMSNDRRLDGGFQTLVGREVYGATSEDQKTKMDKLYARHRPTLDEARRYVAEMCERGHCGPRSRIYNVGEAAVSEALEIARANKISTEQSGIAGLALLLELSKTEEIPAQDEILVVNTGWLALR